MCGIVGYIGPKKVVPVVIEGLRKLEYRGYDSAGIAVVTQDGKLEIRRAPGIARHLRSGFSVRERSAENRGRPSRPAFRDRSRRGRVLRRQRHSRFAPAHA